MKCPSCQAVVSDDSHFCSKCGASLKGEGQTRTIQGLAPMLKKGQTIAGKYRILQKIGEGGMGVVYKAEDTKLDRPVALKFLPSEMTRDPASKKRFIQEAKAAAALSHPNITVVYEIGEDKGQTFIAMEFIEGKTLRDKIESGPLEIEEAVNIASQVAEGLKEAHDKGIIHRDIKPANIMMTKKGQAKIMDFGLAKLAWGADLTKPSMIMGTVAYMSPEQARGEPIDLRTDIWAYGCVLYEMFTGRRPFKGTEERAVFYSILNEEPTPVRSIRREIPVPIEKIIHKALEKDRRLRYQNMGEPLQEMKPRPISIDGAASPSNSIAVLPFTNMSADPEQEYFCDGMTEEIINALTQIKDLLVIARTSSFVFKGKQEDIREIGKKLNVGTVLEGSVRKSGDRLRITAQLIKVADGTHLWSERYDRRIKDVFDIQDEITLAIVDKLKIRLIGMDRKAIVRRYTDNPELYRLYLLGLHHWYKFTPHDFIRSEEYFEKAINLDPDYALAYAGIAEINVFNTFFMGITPKQAMQKAKKYLGIAIKIDEDLGEAHAVLGRVQLFYDWDWEGADREFKRALELNPNSAMILSHYSDFLSIAGQHEEAIQTVKRARKLDPLSVYINTNAGERILHAGRFDEAIEVFKKVIDMEPHHYYAYSLLGIAYYAKSDFKESLKAQETAYELSGRIPMGGVNLACVYYKQGKAQEGDLILNALKDKAKEEYVPASLLSILYLVRREMDEAYAWWKKACDDRDFMLPFFLNFPVPYMRMPKEKRFHDLIDKMRPPK